MYSCTKNVGTGSSEHDLVGDDISRRRTSCSVHCRKHAIADVATDNSGGGGSPAVSERTASTLRAKNAAKPSAVWSVAPDTSRSLPSKDDNERHSVAE